MIMILSLPELYNAAVRLASEREIPIVFSERKVMSVDHCIAGKIICDEWKMPEEISEVVFTHHVTDEGLRRSMNPLVHVVRLANALCRKTDIGFPGDYLVPDPDPIDMEILGSTQEKRDAVFTQLEDTLKMEKTNIEDFFRQLKPS